MQYLETTVCIYVSLIRFPPSLQILQDLFTHRIPSLCRYLQIFQFWCTFYLLFGIILWFVLYIFILQFSMAKTLNLQNWINFTSFSLFLLILNKPFSPLIMMLIFWCLIYVSSYVLIDSSSIDTDSHFSLIFLTYLTEVGFFSCSPFSW